jgi:hypothetical protein
VFTLLQKTPRGSHPIFAAKWTPLHYSMYHPNRKSMIKQQCLARKNYLDLQPIIVQEVKNSRNVAWQGKFRSRILESARNIPDTL